MFLRSPAERYIKCLLLQQRKASNAQIQEMLERDRLDFISEDYLNQLRALLQPLPEPFAPRDRAHARSRKYLVKHQVWHFFDKLPEMREAEELLRSARAREFVETMLITHAPVAKIPPALFTHRDYVISDEGLRAFKRYYWDIDLLDTVQLRTLLQYRYDSLSHSDTTKPIAAAAKKASYQDPRKLAADLPFSPLSAMLVQMRMGLKPARLNVATRIEAARNLAALRVEECLCYATPSDASKALNYAMTAKIMNELLDTVQRPDEALREELSAIALRSDPRGVPTLQQLSGGRHTADLQPIKQGEDHVLDSIDTDGDGSPDSGD
jgi:hypothetical protein